jgi:hypothetical protein
MQLRDYYSAIFHYQKAAELATDSSTLVSIRQYLAYNYTLTENYPALLQQNHLIIKENNITPSKYPVIAMAHTEYGMKTSSDENLYKTLHYFQAGITATIRQRMSVYVAYSGISQQTYYGDMSQHQLYASGNIALGNNWMISPAIHILSTNFTNLPPFINKDTFPSPTSYAANIGISKTIGKWNIATSSALSKLNGEKQFQQQIGVTFFPMGNNNLSINLQALLQFHRSDSFKFVPSVFGRYVILQSRTKPFQMALSAGFQLQNTRYTVENNAYLVSNNYDMTHQRIMAGFDARINSNIAFYGNYIYESKTEYFSYTKYNYNMFLAGFRYTFN